MIKYNMYTIKDAWYGGTLTVVRGTDVNIIRRREFKL